MNIGYLFNCSMRTNPIFRLSPSVINRAMLIDSALRQRGSRIFFYSPKNIRSLTDKVPGYLIEDQAFVPTTCHVPRINGNWTYSTKRLLAKGMGYQQFLDWSKEHGISVYVPLSFSELVVNKLETFKALSGYRHSTHPYTERYRRSSRQLRAFLDRGDLVFLKKRAGNKGDGMVSLRRCDEGFATTFYKNAIRRSVVAPSLKAAVGFISEVTRESSKYVIQQGVESLRHNGSVFDLRVVMLFDGANWHWLHEARYSPVDSDLSNVSQGGISLETEELLFDLLGRQNGAQVLDRLREESFGLARFLDERYPGELMEIAFDFILDEGEGLHLVEINTKPGLVSVGFESNFFDAHAGQRDAFERWVYPHTESLASFLQSKVEAL